MSIYSCEQHLSSLVYSFLLNFQSYREAVPRDTQITARGSDQANGCCKSPSSTSSFRARRRWIKVGARKRGKIACMHAGCSVERVKGWEQDGKGVVVDSGCRRREEAMASTLRIPRVLPVASPIFRLRSIYEYVTKSRGKPSWTWSPHCSRVRGTRKPWWSCK